MNSREKLIAYNELKGGISNLEADRALLEKVDPTNPLLQKKVYKPESMATEVLYALLDYATREEVVKNRREFGKQSKTDDQCYIDALKQDAKKKAIVYLLASDTPNIEYNVMKQLVVDLELTPVDFKKVSLIAALYEYKLNLEKEAAGTVEKMDEVPTDVQGENTLEAESTESHSDQVIDQMNADPIAKLTAEIAAIKEQLKTPETLGEAQEDLELRLDRLESELEDLQCQNENLQEQVDGLAEDLEAEKKSQGA